MQTCERCGTPYPPTRAGQKFCSRACQLKARQAPLRSNVHVVIPDTQARQGAPTDHLQWIGRYISDRYSKRNTRLTVIHLGDHWDMPSLSSYDRGTRLMEGRRFLEDVQAGNDAWRILTDPFAHLNCRRILLRGNHENRIVKATVTDAQLDGLLTDDLLESPGWEVVPFLTPVTVDGVVYAHYFYSPMTGKPFGGNNIELRLKTLGHSFTMGHQQTLQYGIRFVQGRSQHGLVAGACYLHDEDYKGPQGNAHWRGIIVCHDVEGGSYDPMFVSLDYLCRRFEGCRLSEFMERQGAA